MRDPVPAEHGEVFGLQPVAVPQLNAVAPPGGQLAQERIEVGRKLPAMLVVQAIEPRKLEGEQAHLRTHRFAGREESTLEQVGIEEMLVGRPALVPNCGRFGNRFSVMSSVTLNVN